MLCSLLRGEGLGDDPFCDDTDSAVDTLEAGTAAPEDDDVGG